MAKAPTIPLYAAALRSRGFTEEQIVQAIEEAQGARGLSVIRIRSSRSMKGQPVQDIVEEACGIRSIRGTS